MIAWSKYFCWRLDGLLQLSFTVDFKIWKCWSFTRNFEIPLTLPPTWKFETQWSDNSLNIFGKMKFPDFSLFSMFSKNTHHNGSRLHVIMASPRFLEQKPSETFNFSTFLQNKLPCLIRPSSVPVLPTQLPVFYDGGETNNPW